MSKRILVAVDASAMSVNALSWALHNLVVSSNPKDTTLMLLYVQPFWTAENLNILHADSTSKVHDDSKAIVKSHRDTVDRVFQDHQISNVTVEDVILSQDDSVEFSAGSAICEFVDSLLASSEVASCHLIVGSKEKGFFEKAFLGSVSEHCVRNAACPVTVVKLMKTKAQ
jgi:nucleotide-binding universal stress UspA family protein